jgi:hypothetical protein
MVVVNVTLPSTTGTAPSKYFELSCAGNAIGEQIRHNNMHNLKILIVFNWILFTKIGIKKKRS